MTTIERFLTDFQEKLPPDYVPAIVLDNGEHSVDQIDIVETPEFLCITSKKDAVTAFGLVIAKNLLSLKLVGKYAPRHESGSGRETHSLLDYQDDDDEGPVFGGGKSSDYR